MVVSQVDASSSITAGWIIMLTVVCTVVMLGVIAASTWKIYAPQQQAIHVVGAEQQI